MLCKHEWQILSETTTKSGVELLGKVMDLKSVKCSSDLTKRKFIQLVSCKKCGKLKRFVEVI